MANWEEQFGIFLIPEVQSFTESADAESATRTCGGSSRYASIFRRSTVPASAGPCYGRSSFMAWLSQFKKQNPGHCGADTAPIEDDLGTGNPKLQITMGPMIGYEPAQHELGNLCEKTRHGGLGQIWIQGHEVLLHELVHALRMVSFKKNSSLTTKGFAFYDDPEELYAVLVQGIYASERKKPVRSSHTAHFAIDKQLDGSLEFYRTGTESFDLISRFCTENPGFTKEIACIETHFNPIRAFYFTPTAAKQMAQSKLAKARDRTEPLFNDAYHWLLHQFQTGALHP